MKVYLFIISCCIVSSSFGQLSFFTIQDSLKADYYSGGDLDSVDLYFGNQSSTFIDGGNGQIENTFTPSFFINNLGGQNFHTPIVYKSMLFSALPHLGFGYSFGTQGSQYLTTNYQQAFSDSILLNVNYDFTRSTGFLRNGDVNKHLVQIQFKQLGKRYSNKVSATVRVGDFGQNGGISTDTLLNDFGTLFTSVNKEDARTEYRNGELVWENYFAILSKDSLFDAGLYIVPGIDIYNRKYFEVSDTLSLIYPETNYSVTNTTDQYQKSEVSGLAGVFYSGKNYGFKGGIVNRYWEYYNLGNNLYQHELDLEGDAVIKIGRSHFQANAFYNLFGAGNQWRIDGRATWKQRLFEVSGRVRTGEQVQDAYQRAYYSNHMHYEWDGNFEKQYFLGIDGQVKYKLNEKLIFGGSIDYIGLANVLYFDNYMWSQAAGSDFTALKLGINTDVHWGVLVGQLKLSAGLGEYVPSFLGQSRIMLQGRLFEGKKLLAQIGVEGSYNSAYSTLGYTPLMDAYHFGSTSVSDSRTNLHAFGAFQVDQFRLFFRVENIAYFWNDARIELYEKYPLTPMQIRVGFTWDFFN